MRLEASGFSIYTVSQKKQDTLLVSITS